MPSADGLSISIRYLSSQCFSHPTWPSLPQLWSPPRIPPRRTSVCSAYPFAGPNILDETSDAAYVTMDHARLCSSPRPCPRWWHPVPMPAVNSFYTKNKKYQEPGSHPHFSLPAARNWTLECVFPLHGVLCSRGSAYVRSIYKSLCRRRRGLERHSRCL